MEIKEVTREEATKIIDTREPVGLFYEVDRGIFIGIDNLYGHANVEEFTTRESCFNWLRREPEPIDEKEIYVAALTRCGPGAQIVMVFEEMAELQKELCKYSRGEKVITNITEEIADVEIMLGQMKELFNIEAAVKAKKEFKLERLAGLVEGINARVCKVCGCTDYRGCDGGCYWVEHDLCSKCTVED